MAAPTQLQRATPSDLISLAELVRSLRPDWPRHLVDSILTSHAHHVDLADLVVASVRCAKDPSIRDPYLIGHAARHWHDLDTKPQATVDTSAICGVCYKTRAKCLDRPGAFDPDDPRADPHPFTPIDRAEARAHR